jgi:plastocyanin
MLAVAIALLGVASLSFGLRGVAAQDGAAVNIVDFAFEPAAVEVPVGATVTWTNGGGAPHTVTADDGAFNSGNLDPGATFSQTFDSAGSFPYHCEIHPQMTGTVNVTEGAAAAEAIPAEGEAAPADEQAAATGAATDEQAAAQTTRVPRTGVGAAAIAGLNGAALLAALTAVVLGVAATIAYRRA